MTRNAVRVEARTLQAGDVLTTGGTVTEVRPGHGRTVHVYTDDQEGYAIEHVDNGVWIRTRDADVQERLEYLRGEIRAERISYGEIAELQSLVDAIDPDDVELLAWAKPEDDDDGD